MYTKAMFGKELKDLVKQKVIVENIGAWSYSTYFKNMMDLELGLSDVMLGLSTMEGEEEFAISYKNLNKIADDLIAGKNVDLNSEDYRD